MVRYRDIRPILSLMQCRVHVVAADDNLDARRKHIAQFDKSKSEVVYNQYLDGKAVRSIEIVDDGDYQGLLITVENRNEFMED